MNLPFTIDQFVGVFEQYNLSVFPMQFVAYLLGFFAVWLIINNKQKDRIVCAVLSLFWLWNGVVYHVMYFSSINKAAYVFGGLFVIQGILLLILGVYKNDITFGLKPNIYSYTAVLFILYAMIIYPLIGILLGHSYPEAPIFGIAPCPTTIFTWGVILLANRPVAKKLLVIPLLWSIIGFGAALSLGIKEDIGLLAAGIIGCVLVIVKNRSYNVYTRTIRS